MIRQFLSTTTGALFLLSNGLVNATDSDLQRKIDSVDCWMHQAVESLRIPGIAVAVVVDGQTVLAKGYGFRDVAQELPVTEQTLFAIGSCSKAFTAFALGQLADDGWIAWDDPVIKHIPEFRVSDIYATHYITIRDLVAHRTGYARHDFVWYGSTAPRSEILKRIEYLEPVNQLREKFQYNNLMYAVAGLVIERVTGQTWEEFVQKRIFDPLGMKQANFSVDVSQRSENFSLPYSEREEQVTPIPFRNLDIVGPAGSINACAANMAQWIKLHLGEGSFEGNLLIHPETLKSMHKTHMPLEYPSYEETPYIFGYGLGWMIGLHKGRYTVVHGGGIDGFTSSIALFPKEKMGVVILTNSDRHFLFPTYAAYGIADRFLGEEQSHWLTQVQEKEKKVKETLKTNDKVATPSTMPIRPFSDYLGEFEHPGYGSVHIREQNGELQVSLNAIVYQLKHKCYDHFSASCSQLLDYQIHCSFVSDDSGKINAFHLSTEPSLPPTIFKRKVENELLRLDYLKKFIGRFEGPVFSIEIALKKNSLIAIAAGRLACEMKPEKPWSFSLKEMPGYSLQFVADTEGNLTELQVHQFGQIFRLKPKN